MKELLLTLMIAHNSAPMMHEIEHRIKILENKTIALSAQKPPLSPFPIVALREIWLHQADMIELTDIWLTIKKIREDAYRLERQILQEEDERYERSLKQGDDNET